MLSRKKRKPPKTDPRCDDRQRAGMKALDLLGAEAAKELAFIELLRLADKKAKT